MTNRKVLLLLATIQIVSAFKFTGYNCEDKQTNISIIDAFKVEDCKPINQTQIVQKNISIQIVQEKLFETIQIQHCYITKLSLISYCGTFSYASMVRNGLHRKILPINRQQCAELHKTQTFSYNGFLITETPLNGTKTVEITERGSVDFNGNCRGVSFQNEQGSFQNSIMITTLTITLEDYENIYSKNDQAVIFKDGSTCPISNGMCFSRNKGTSIWHLLSENNCDANSVDILYQGMAIHISLEKDTDININDMIAVNQNDNIFSYKIRESSHLCYQKILKTNMKRIGIIVETPSFGFFFKKRGRMNPQNLDFPMYLNAKMEYITQNLQDSMKQLFSEVQLADCELAKANLENRLAIARTNDVYFGHIINQSKGHINIFSGHVFYAYKCVPEIVQLRETEKCYKNIPVVFKNKSLYIEPIAHTFTENPNEVPCTKLTPPKFFINGNWLANDGSFDLTSAPKLLSPTMHEYNIKFENWENILVGGIYNEELINQYTKYLSNSQLKIRASDVISQRIIDSNVMNDFNFVDIMTKNEITQLKSTLLTGLEDKITKFGSYAGAIIGTIFIIQTIKQVISLIVNFKMLNTTLGFGFHLICSIFTSMTNYIIRNNLKSTEEQEETQA